MSWIRLTPDDVAAINKAKHVPGIADLIDRIQKQEAEQGSLQAYRGAVETNDELEVDDDAIVSPGDDPGAWVHAWVWVANEQAGIEDDEESAA